MYNFCTLFDSNYLSRGLAMYESLIKYMDDFHMFILAFDTKCADILKQLSLKKASIITLEDFEDEKLMKIKSKRSVGEYCWTCTPSLIKYCLEKYSLKDCTYLDADLFFFDNPEVFFDEMGKSSVLITKHNYTSVYDRSSISGIYCVQFLIFKNDEIGIKVLDWWRDACIDWCYARYENGKFGDQKYLDDWPIRFHGVHVLEHLGTIAPWNVQKYQLYKKEKEKLLLIDKRKKNIFNTIFFHFHSVNFLSDNVFDLGPYILDKWVLEEFYSPYLCKIFELNKFLEKNFELKIYLTKNNDSKIINYFTKVNFLRNFWLNFFNVLTNLNIMINNNKIFKHLVRGYNVYNIDYFLKKE